MKFVRCEGESGRQELVNLRCVSVVTKEKNGDEVFCNVSYRIGKWMNVAPNSDGNRVFEDAVIDI